MTKALKNVLLGLWLSGLLIVYVLMFWNAIFPYDEAEHTREEIAEENAKGRAKAIKRLQEQYMEEHH